MPRKPVGFARNDKVTPYRIDFYRLFDGGPGRPRVASRTHTRYYTNSEGQRCASQRWERRGRDHYCVFHVAAHSWSSEVRVP